jgi:hypothetical protein
MSSAPNTWRWLAAVDCFAEVAKSWLEPAIAAAGPLYSTSRRKSTKVLGNVRSEESQIHCAGARLTQ